MHYLCFYHLVSDACQKESNIKLKILPPEPIFTWQIRWNTHWIYIIDDFRNFSMMFQFIFQPQLKKFQAALVSAQLTCMLFSKWLDDSKQICLWWKCQSGYHSQGSIYSEYFIFTQECFKEIRFLTLKINESFDDNILRIFFLFVALNGLCSNYRSMKWKLPNNCEWAIFHICRLTLL